MSVGQPTESPFDHDRYFTFTVNDETYNGSIHFLTHYAENPGFVEVIRRAFFRDETYGDTRADWHRNTTPFYAWVKAHMLRLAWDCREEFLRYFLHSLPNICRDFGFPVAHDRDTSGAPSQSRLWEIWNKEFTDVQREFVRTATEEAIAYAREQGIPAPDPVFRPEERDITSKRSEQRLVAEKTKEVWQQAKPFVTDTFYLKRAENTVVHENALWEQHVLHGDA